jgi:GDPmannose 4,6-dehydratase
VKAIIFGINGQDGYYLSQLLIVNKVEVIGISRSSGHFTGDVSDFAFVESIIKHHKADFIFHFAANSTTRHEVLFENHHTISTGTINILESVRLHSPSCKVFLSGSAMQFRNEGRPINEQTAFEASSPYSVARIQSVYAGRYYRSAFGLKVYVGYFFNHDSPLRSEKHVNQKIVAAVRNIASGSAEKLELGNVDVKKEFNYALDVVEAVWQLINQEEVFETVIGCGYAHSILEWVEYCFAKVNLDWRNYLVTEEGFKPEYNVLVSDPQLIKSLGWQPKIDFYQLADIMMAHK